MDRNSTYFKIQFTIITSEKNVKLIKLYQIPRYVLKFKFCTFL